ncbi:GL18548 [Drosophila persimilis]|uniref:GL18548 n=1 Tax=Drosophila persimilis TaxID=7234 RepID=B4G6R9_DROPE|nr:GL18548 [Drosophila persimilis]
MDTGLCILAASLLSSVICYSVEPTRTWVADNPNWGPKKAHDIWFSQVKKPFPNCPEYKFPINTDVNCVKTPEGGECEVSCIGKNHFYGEQPNVRKMILSCRRGTWGIKNGAPTAKTIQHCDGACICRNGGICNGEKVCHCRKGYGGVSCEKYKEFACPEEPPQLPRNSKTVCRGDTCEVQCSRGFSLADGRSRVLLKCEGTKYIDLAGGHTKISDCEATCSPVCLNGGKCIAANVCECPPNFRGKQCQYPVSSCNITTFNGNFQCDHAPDRSECRLTCPSLPGVSVQGTLQSLYVCDYSTGQFQPTPAVKCIYHGSMTLSTPSKKLSLPVQVLGMKIVTFAQHIEVDLESVGLQLIWDHHQQLAVHASVDLWQKLGGLCGHLDGNCDNDLMSRSGSGSKAIRTFTDSWRNADQTCVLEPDEDLAQCHGDRHKKAVSKCKDLLYNLKLKSCLEQFNQETLLRTCISDQCACDDGQDCSCNLLQSLVDECRFEGLEPAKDWRNLQLCPISCSGGRIYQTPPARMKECPEGKLQYRDTCIERKMCPCELRGREFQPGEKHQKDCNTCLCHSGKWQCTDNKCDKRCSAFGDPHYRTFDGKRYDFQGRCLYFLLKTSSRSVEGENIKCSGAIDEAVEPSPTGHSCTRSIVLRFTLRDGGPTVIKLDQKLHSSVNGEAVTQLPLELGNCEVVLRLASHHFLTVTFDDGLVVWWNSQSTVHIDAPYSYFDNTAGLCGTFNDNTKDDFLTPDGDYEGTALKVAEEICLLIRSDTFSPCHWAVDPTSHYEDCIADICAAKDSTPSPATTNKALCELLADYAHLCVRNGIHTSWRQSIKQCSIKCPDGQEYDECGDSCALSCHDLQHRDQCKRQCIEGCRCPKGHFLNDEQECVPQKACSCHYEGISFKPGYKEVRPGPRVQQLCTCLDGLWQCHDADKDDLIVYPPLGNLRKQCAKTPYAKFVSCAPKEPRTCKNMHDFKPDTAACRPGCVCDDGYVYDVTRQQCVPSEKCSCYHAGRSFDDGDTFKELCNLCVCQGGSWKCSRNDCESSCSIWGDSHFSTFDGKDFDFLGECDYILSKGVNDQGLGFSIVIQNVLCGSSGVTCSKSLEINLSGKASEGKGQGQEQLKLSAGGIYATDSNTSTIAGLRKQISSHSSSSFHIYKAGVFVVVEVLSLHLQIKWDEGTRVYVKIGNEWQGRVAGLCGNNNGNSLDDFKPPSGGQETEPTLFGHSWRTHQQCVLPQQLFDSCQRNPQRRAWSELQCSVLKSPLFAACHVEVPLERYLKRCIFDTCSCDQGGDCECLCTAVAAYADACAQKSINVRWRTPHFCPMQCDTHCSDYSACTPACPVETCDNLLDQGDSGRLCHHENCVEGCLIKPCPPGQIYLNDTHTVCVPRSECKPVCLVREDITYYEGDITYTDDCATCRCSKKKEVCSGKPCPPVVTTEGPSVTGTGTVPNQDRGKNCVRGWSRWLDRGSSAGGINLNDVEPLPKFDRFQSIYGTCNRGVHDQHRMPALRTPNSRTTLWDDNVVCNLDRGLCLLHCLCDDDGYTTAKPPPPPPPPPPPTEICDPSFQMFKEYPGDCYKYLRCEHIPGNTNWHWVPGSCGTNLMFNTAIGACDQVSIVSRIRPECRKITDRCRDDEEWNDCANQCEHTCHFFGQQLIKRGLCNPGEHCKGGCVPKKRPDCRALGKFWRDENTCVDQDDCPCLDDDNDKYVQPHGIIINDQFDCQCVFNQYVCVPKKTTTEAPPIGGHTTTTALPLIPTTLTPPVLCPTNSMVRFFTREPSISDSAFSASSSLSNDHVAHLARLHRKPKLNAGAWTPKISDQSQYLQVDFERPQGIYGLLIAGDPHNDNYVTLFKVLYSLDGEGYHELIDQRGEPQVLIGPKDSRVARAHVFQRPIEAKSVRLYPLRWQNVIAMRFDLLLCNHVPTTTAPVPDRTTPLPPTKPPLDRLICDDPLGVDNGKLQPHQVTASSIWLSSQVDSQVGLLDLLQFRSQLGWRPLANKQDEYVDFDFLEPRNVTAVQTRGGVHGWVTAYRVLFSLNRLVWNELPGPNGDAHIFEGNRDAQGIQTNGFVRPLVTRYLRLLPTGWEKNINWRIEPLGCFLPYPNTTKPILRPCTVCKGIDLPSLTGGDCPCSDGLFWSGYKCIERNLCPCIDNFTPPETEASPALPLGIIELLKKIGIAQPTISDYSDTDQAGDELELDSETLLLVNGVRGTKDKSELSLYGYNFQLPRELQALMGLTPYIATRDLKNMELCDAFCCLPQSNKTCMDPKCPEGYEPIVDTSSIGAGKSPIYTCRRSRIPDDTCDITGRIFSTFDSTVYKYDICSHTLARDTDGNRWSISTQLQCAPDQPSCGAKTLIISDQQRGITISILPNQRVIFNGYEFSVRDLALVNAIRRSFVISQIGETIVVVCRQHKFWVQYAASGNIRIGVSQDLLGRVDGLCGFYNGRSDDDKRTPQRLHVISSTDFGDAWYDRKVPLDKCRPQVCPVDLQQRALQMCQAVRHPSFGACSVSVNIQDFLSRCVENTCECLKANAGAEGSCRCDLLQQFVGQCLAVNRHLQLTSWRSVHRCNQTCRPPLIHHDCYRQRCEQQCGDLQSGQTASVCPSIPRTCFSGCYCPEGTVRRGEECVPIEDCKDCKCTLFGASKFVTYDGSSYSFKGNCTYLVTRDLLLPGSYHFQVYATIKPCGPTETESCVQALHVTAGENTLHIERHAQDVKLLADGYQVSLWPHQSTWLKVIQQREQQLIVQLPQAKLELIVNLNTLQFQLSVPSVRYGSRMEGLCGNCNGLSIDDLHINPLKKPTDQRPLGLIDFVTSWQIDEPRLGINTRPCQGHQICKPLPRERNLCYHLIVQSGIFDRCPLLVDPLAFIQACQKDTCTATTDKQVICDALSAYAAECNAAGVCVDWRPFAECPAQCPPGLSYKSCDCDVNCDTGVDRVDQSNLAIIFKGRCLHTERHEGCFCPDDKVLHHGKCVSPSKCITCGDGRHVGDVWQPDKCTNCTCLASGQVSCEKEQCGRDADHICQKGFTQVVLQRDYECCPTRICVGNIEKPPGHVCEKPKLPDCGPDQHRIVDKDVNECPIYICECKPKVQCEPTSPVKLRPGEELQPVDDGCCPGQRVVCVLSKCPKPPAVCDEHHYELISEKLPGDCCAVHKTVNTILSCDKKCPLGYTYEHTNSAKCCGSCVPTGCHHDGKLYKPDEQWRSLDKCITYTCVSLDGQLIRHESHETCADVSQCPLADLVDNGGCCKQCKSRPPTLDKTGCQAVSLPLQHTVRLIRYKSQDHGQCFNEQPIQGVTQCDGACDSAFKYNPLLIKFEDKCSCCAATGLRTVLVKVKCADGNYLEQSLEVPTGCSCEPCNKHHLAKVQPVEEPKPVSVGELLDKEKENDDEEEINLQDLLDQSGGVITR